MQATHPGLHWVWKVDFTSGPFVQLVSGSSSQWTQAHTPNVYTLLGCNAERIFPLKLPHSLWFGAHGSPQEAVSQATGLHCPDLTRALRVNSRLSKMELGFRGHSLSFRTREGLFVCPLLSTSRREVQAHLRVPAGHLVGPSRGAELRGELWPQPVLGRQSGGTVSAASWTAFMHEAGTASCC